ncbi:zinc finger protein ZFP2-like [Plodia interpunctella]|uniref:zinc finger protein ZFP2-like n=1 Tax=Plodia interpunctella TaxID=58824 RepID=UPI0023683F9B|nr:zinc finger protein ZFP2-like [Plodia interpunctella]
MEDNKICRVCLIMGVKMYDAKSYPMKNYLDAIAGATPLGEMHLPTFICYQCGALAQKYFFFKEKCIHGQTALFDMLSVHGRVDVTEIPQLRKFFKLISPICLVDQINFIDCCHGDISKGTNESAKEEIVAVKYEPYEDSSIPLPETLEDDLYEHIKDEDGYKYEEFFNSVSSDDEPLSTHKRNKTEENQRVELTEELLTEVPVKRKRGRPRKGEVQAKSGEANTCPKPQRKRKARRRVTDNTGGVSEGEDIDLEQYVEIIHLTEEEQIQEIEKRKESSNYQNAAFQCNFCYKGFIDAQAFKHHSAKHDPSAGNIKCPICKIRFKNKRAYMKHYMNHEKKYQCKACPYVSKTSTQAKQHQRWHKGVTYKCQYCDEVSTKWTSYLSHVRMKHPSEFICGVCGYSFVSKLGLTMHRTMMHKGIVESQELEGEAKEGESKPYCSVCDVKFVSEEAFKRHMVMSTKHTKTNEDSHGCRSCGEAFPSAETLRAHQRAAHARKRPRNYGKRPPPYCWPAPCTHCGEQVPSGRAYWTHFRRAHPGLPYPVQKDYVCDVCGKSFRGNAFLVYHKRTHTDERAYKCSLCPKAFHNRTNLQMHQKTHSDHRPHPCTVCFKAFKSKGALDRHFRSHTGVKPYECEVCGKAFNQSNSRKLHVRTVHLRQPAPYVSRNRDKRRAPPEHF